MEGTWKWSQTKCFASTLSYEGNNSGDKEIQNGLKKT